jgi:capsular polysaccharide biosynthesis protein
MEHLGYDKHLNPILIADHYKPVLKGYKDHNQLPVYPFKRNLPSLRLTGNHYYMGLLNPHYGHFFLESLTRFWLAMKKPNLLEVDTKFVFHVYKNFSLESENRFFSSNLTEYLNALGIRRENIIFVRKPTTFERIIVPETTVSISDGNCYFADESKHVCSHLNGLLSINHHSKQGQCRKVYITRKLLNNPVQGRAIENESDVEHYFRDIGFDIVAPETLTQSEVQSILSDTTFIAGTPGSGLLNSFFIPHHATTLGLTCLPATIYNPGLNHQINANLISGHKSLAYFASDELTKVEKDSIKWKVDIDKLDEKLTTHL